MLDRTSPDQYHYYQRNSPSTLRTLEHPLTSTAGIGTYAHNQTSNSSTPGGLFSRLKASIESSVDQAIGTSFVHHVLAGYRFLMRYYSQGDHIYIFGFSRGAYTARFLAEMIQDIGLLSKGNEEMVHFAWNTFSDYQRTTKEEKEKKKFMDEFKKTFCRLDVNIYFLGLFDCVNSVGQFEIPLFRKSSPRIPISPANHIRHAVSIHERRLKFKPALFGLDDSQKSADTDLKEMWFAGNHGDIGGGWGPQGNSRLLSDIPLKWMIEEVKSLESDIPLKWMIEEVKSLDDASHLAINDDKMQSLIPDPKLNYNAPHDMLAFGSGPFRQSWPGVLGWWILGSSRFLSTSRQACSNWYQKSFPSLRA